jgi:hypothetical protein
MILMLAISSEFQSVAATIVTRMGGNASAVPSRKAR